jgi:hypothetical protein
MSYLRILDPQVGVGHRGQPRRRLMGHRSATERSADPLRGRVAMRLAAARELRRSVAERIAIPRHTWTCSAPQRASATIASRRASPRSVSA